MDGFLGDKCKMDVALFLAHPVPDDFIFASFSLSLSCRVIVKSAYTF